MRKVRYVVERWGKVHLESGEELMERCGACEAVVCNRVLDFCIVCRRMYRSHSIPLNAGVVKVNQAELFQLWAHVVDIEAELPTG